VTDASCKHRHRQCRAHEPGRPGHPPRSPGRSTSLSRTYQSSPGTGTSPPNLATKKVPDTLAFPGHLAG
jgi:hypothetical protein